VVEDNSVNLMLARAVLEKAGYEVDGAGSARDAMERLATGAPDLILIDIQLPGVDGIALARWLKSGPATARIPLVALSAHAMQRQIDSALAAGCEAYITKPINTRTFARTVATVLESRETASGERGD